ncbi:hypothetical protein WME97_25415 [Sorangium sp. So ce367]|uniref:hypothetical protein n=1 Tax=Sorangium sp. So ce367 TaxID=3133305 RepID=UPI003F61BBC5
MLLNHDLTPSEYEQYQRQLMDYERQRREYEEALRRRATESNGWQATRRPEQPRSRGMSRAQRARLQQDQDRYFRRTREIYDLAFRLANLGYFTGTPDHHRSTYSGMSGPDLWRLTDAIRRYMFKHALDSGVDPEFIENGYLTLTGDLTTVLEHVIRAHDDRDP